MALDGEIERPEMIVRLPYKSLVGFRATTSPQMADSQITNFGWQLLEQRVTTTDTEVSPDGLKTVTETEIPAWFEDGKDGTERFTFPRRDFRIVE